MLKLPLEGRNVAVMVCSPSASFTPPSTALPLFTVTGLPNAVPSISNWTLPVGVLPPGTLALATVAVKNTDTSGKAGFSEDDTAVVVASAVIISLKPFDVLAAKLLLAGV